VFWCVIEQYCEMKEGKKFRARKFFFENVFILKLNLSSEAQVNEPFSYLQQCVCDVDKGGL
jgi:hypothetical protein